MSQRKYAMVAVIDVILNEFPALVNIYNLFCRQQSPTCALDYRDNKAHARLHSSQAAEVLQTPLGAARTAWTMWLNCMAHAIDGMQASTPIALVD